MKGYRIYRIADGAFYEEIGRVGPGVDSFVDHPNGDPAVEDHSADEIREAREEFESIDTNSDGFISREEILEMDEVPEREEIEEFFDTYDTNHDGKVTFDEILKADEKL